MTLREKIGCKHSSTQAARELANSFFKLSSVPNNRPKNFAWWIRVKVERHLNQEKHLSDWLRLGYPQAATGLRMIVRPELRAQFEARRKQWLAWDKRIGRDSSSSNVKQPVDRAMFEVLLRWLNTTAKKKGSAGRACRRDRIISPVSAWKRRLMAAPIEPKTEDLGWMATSEQQKLGLSAYYDKR